MSVSLYIACKNCRKKLHIGQSPEARIYTGEPETIEQLAQFLLQHSTRLSDIEHTLIFADEHWFEELETTLGITYEQTEICL